MMNYTTHLVLKLTKGVFFLYLLGLSGCKDEVRKEDYIARVNDSYLTREELASLVDTTEINAINKDQLIKSWIRTELLFQQAEKEGITKEKLFQSIVQRSSKELAAALLLKQIGNEEIEFSDSDLLQFYDSNKEYFKVTTDSYLYNSVSFSNEDKAIQFRATAIESDWQKAANLFNKDSSLVESFQSKLFEETDIYPLQVLRILKELYPNEISIVISDNTEYYTVVQLIKKFPAGSTPEFNVVNDEVKSRFLAEKRKEIVDSYLNELYSSNEIEIK